jgi:Transposase IS116/IS110/IS902 family
MVHDDDRADVDPIAVVQHHHAAQWRIAHICAILAARIFDPHPFVAAVQTYETQLRTLIQAIQEFDTRIDKVFAHHVDHDLFDSFPGAGEVCAPRLLAAFDTDRPRWQAATELQTHSGIALLTERSGKAHWVQHRLACPKFVKQTFTNLRISPFAFRKGLAHTTSSNAGAATITTRPYKRSPISGSGFCFAVGKIANRTMKERTSRVFAGAGHR